MSPEAQTNAAPPSRHLSRFAAIIGVFVIVFGGIFMVAGAATWVEVRTQLKAENIVVADDAAHFAGQRVDDPLTAMAQANIINKHALEMSGGKTYAELPRDDPKRATVMNASFLRASLFTSVVAFGVAAMALGVGLVFILVGAALMKLGKNEG